jgi:hypothetical protein
MLVVEALQKAGAKGAGYYVYGRELRKGEPWLPGDVLQFTSCVFVEDVGGRTMTTRVGAPRHTSVVYAPSSSGLIKVLHQNVGGDKRVQEQVMNFNAMVSGTIKVYRPQPPDSARAVPAAAAAPTTAPANAPVTEPAPTE